MPVLYTVGHSTRSIDEFLDLLGAASVRRLVDVRRFPTSRRHPHFRSEALADSLARHEIAYVHEVDLGGRRSPQPHSPNTAWRTEGFRGYADHMDSSAFRAALQRVIDGAGRDGTAIMCAEAVPWRCHRRLISDALVVRGFDVVHLIGPGRSEPHTLNPNARVVPEGRLVYPARPPEQKGLFG